MTLTINRTDRCPHGRTLASREQHPCPDGLPDCTTTQPGTDACFSCGATPDQLGDALAPCAAHGTCCDTCHDAAVARGECDGCDQDPWTKPVHYGTCPLAPQVDDVDWALTGESWRETGWTGQ